MRTGLARRALARAPRFLLGFALISLGSILVPYLIGVVAVLIGLALILPKESLKATLQTAGESSLTGTFADQAQLHGLLDRLRDLGIDVVSVNPVTDEQAPTAGGRPCPR